MSPNAMNDQQLGQQTSSSHTFSPPRRLDHSPKRPSPLRHCQIASIPDFNKTASLRERASADYLRELRNNRVARLNGSRPAPPSRIASKRETQRPSSRNADQPILPPKSTTESAIEPEKQDTMAMPRGHSRAKSAPVNRVDRNTAGRPLVPAPSALGTTALVPDVEQLKKNPPGAIYMENGQRWLDKQEAHSLRLAMGDMQLEDDDEQRIHAAAQDEAAELVYRHRTGQSATKTPITAYTNPDVAKKAPPLTRARGESLPKSLSPGIVPDRPSTSPRTIKKSVDHSDLAKHILDEDDPFVDDSVMLVQTQSSHAKGKSYEQLANQVASDMAQSRRRASSGAKRKPSGDYKAIAFPSPTDKIFEEPDEHLEKARDAEAEKAHDKAEAKIDEVPRHVRRNPFARVKLAQEKFEKRESPSGYTVNRLDKETDRSKSATPTRVTAERRPFTSPSGYSALKVFQDEAEDEQGATTSDSSCKRAERVERVEIQRNAPTQSRKAWYTTNDSAPPTPPKAKEIDEADDEARPKMRDGKEIRGDDIVAATSMKRKDRNPNLIQPTAVSDSPGRPIVSFQAGWKDPKERELKEERVEMLPDSLAIGKTAPTPEALSGKRPWSPTRRESPVSPLPRIELPGNSPIVELPGRQTPVAEMPGIPPISLPDEPRQSAPAPRAPTSISNTSDRRAPPPREPDSIPTITFQIDPTRPAVPIINEPMSIEEDSSRPRSAPHQQPRRPLPQPTVSAPSRSRPQQARPLPTTSKTAPLPATSHPHYTPSVRRNGALCANCALPISGRILSAAGERFHPECFRCHHCSINLECVAFYPEPDLKRQERVARIRQRQQGIDFQVPEWANVTEADLAKLEQDDGDEGLRFFCHLDFHESFSPRCKSCKTPIEGEVVVACGAEWHVGHFFCAQCGDPFDSSTPFVEKEGYAWCVGCHTNRYSAKCKRCRKPVTDVVVKALGAEWHADCFVCVECNGHFDDGRSEDKTSSSVPPSSFRAVTPPCPDRENTQEHGLLDVSPSLTLWTARSGNHSSRRSHSPDPDRDRDCDQDRVRDRSRDSDRDRDRGREPSPELRGTAPQLTFETPSTGPPGSAGGLTSADEAIYYTATWGSPYPRPPRELNLARELFSGQGREREGDSERGSPPSIDLDYLIPTRTSVPGRDFSPSFGLGHLIPPRLARQDFSSDAVGADLLALQQQDSDSQEQGRPATRPRTIRSLTEDWVQQYTPGRWNSKKANWLSDSNEEDNTSDTSDDDDKYKTPIPFTWFAGRHRRRNSTSGSITSRPPSRKSNGAIASLFDTFGLHKGHKTRENNLTLRQEDFWTLVSKGTNSATEANMSIFESRWAVDSEQGVHEDGPSDMAGKSQGSDTKSEKPLPPVPSPGDDKENSAPDALEVKPLDSPVMLKERELERAQERSLTKDKVNEPEPAPEPEHEPEHEPEAPAVKPLPTLPAHAERPAKPLRTKSRYNVKGKATMVLLPDRSPESCGGSRPLSTAEVENRLRQFTDAGYDLRGWDAAGDHAADPTTTQSRPTFPDHSEFVESMQNKHFRVSVPDPKAWKAYCDSLIEAKLAALGVSLGGDESAPAPPSMSRTGSAQYGPNSISPLLGAGPVPAGSHRSTPSLANYPSTTGHSHAASVASPLSIGAPGHLQRHSIFGVPVGMPFGFPQQQTAHSGLPAFSPSQHFNMNGLPRGGSPALDRLKNEAAGAIQSPASPFTGMSPYSRSPQNFDSAFAAQATQPHLRQQSMFTQFTQHSPAVPIPQRTPSLAPMAQLPEEEEEPVQDYFGNARTSQADMIHPSPRGKSQRQNISAGLERDVQDAEYHLERSIERQLEEDTDANESYNEQTGRSEARPARSAYVPPAKRAQMVMNGASASSGKSPSPPLDMANAGLGNQGPFQNKMLNRTKGHVSKLSVAAPEFRFNPGGPQQTFGSNPALPDHVRDQPTGTVDAQAHTFPPGNAFGGFGGQALPTSNFNFSSTHMPALASMHAQQAPSPQPTQASIFGNVNIPDIPDVVKPARKSKAIAIVPPKASSPFMEESARDDSDGRLAPSDERQKRTRIKRDDGDDVPKFAERPASPAMPLPPTKILKSNVEANGMPVTPQKKADKADSKIDVTASSVKTPVQPENGHKKNDSSLSALAKPFDFKPQGSPATAKLPNYPQVSAPKDAYKKKPDFSPDRVFSRGPSSATKKGEGLSVNGAKEPRKRSPSPAVRGASATMPEPTFDELDAIMQQINEDSDGAHVQPTIHRKPTPDSSVIHHYKTPAPQESHHAERKNNKFFSSDAPSPGSPTPQRPTEFFTQSRSVSPIEGHRERFDMPSPPSVTVKRMNRGQDVPLSDWSDDLIADEDSKLQTRSRFFDDRIDSIVGNVLAEHLHPLEQSLQVIHRAITTRTSRQRSRPATGRTVDSDADDEDDMLNARSQFRPVSRSMDKKMEHIKAAVLEALSLHHANQEVRTPMTRMSLSMGPSSDFHHALMDMNATMARIASAHIDADDIRAVVEESLHRHHAALVAAQPEESKEVTKNGLTVEELEERLNETLAGALEEANHRRTAEEREAETRRLLRLAEEELGMYRARVADKDQKIHVMQGAEEELAVLRETLVDKDQRVQVLQGEISEWQHRAVTAEAAQSSLEKQLAETDAENMAYEKTLDEYRLSHAQSKKELEDARSEVEALTLTVEKYQHRLDDHTADNEALRTAIDSLKAQISDGLNLREKMRDKLEQFHADMASAAEQVAVEKSTWQARNEDLHKKNAVLQARIEGEQNVRRSIEEEIKSLRAQVHDGITAKISLEQAQRTISMHEETLRTLKADLAGEQTLATRLERDLHEARESGRAEVQRTQMIMQSNIEAANSQAELMRASLEHEIAHAKAEVDDLRLNIDTAKARHELLLEEEADLRRDALRKVNETSSAALNDLRQRHSEELRYYRVQHERDLANALQDKQRSEGYLNDRLHLSNDQVVHLQERVALLEERLQVSQSAAQAAVTAARESARSAPSPAFANATTAAVSNVQSAAEPEGLSKQALRESILVLQEQLQDRETTIETLQSQVSDLDTSAPQKLKERDTEITWLRELLAVRVDDLSELIRTLEGDEYEKETVRDAAIRIKAGLQMEQAEKERLINAGTSVVGQSLAGLMNAASPGAAKLASAWGNWRKGRGQSTSSNLAPSPSTKAAGKAPARSHSVLAKSKQLTIEADEHDAATPSKANKLLPSPSIFAGLMTPPATSLRRTPSPDPKSSAPQQSQSARPLFGRTWSRERSTANLISGTRSALSQSFGTAEAPSTGGAQGREHSRSRNVEAMGFLRRQSYDSDADDGDLGHMMPADENDADAVMEAVAQTHIPPLESTAALEREWEQQQRDADGHVSAHEPVSEPALEPVPVPASVAMAEPEPEHEPAPVPEAVPDFDSESDSEPEVAAAHLFRDQHAEAAQQQTQDEHDNTTSAPVTSAFATPIDYDVNNDTKHEERQEEEHVVVPGKEDPAFTIQHDSPYQHNFAASPPGYSAQEHHVLGRSLAAELGE